MKEFERMILWEASFDRSLFRNELEKYLKTASEQEKFDALKYCYEKYSDSYPEILLDVFLNIAGGLKINDPATDLAVISSILSSNIDVAIHHKFCFAGEVGLTGEIRSVSRIEQRITEAEKIGFHKIYIPTHNKNFQSSKFKIEMVRASRVEEVFRNIFG